MTVFVWVWAVISSLWAIVVTIMLVRNPLPLPDRGHRAYSLPSEAARRTVLTLLARFGLKERFTFDAGPTHQTLMQDGLTVLNHLESPDPDIAKLPGSAISLPVKDPRKAAGHAIELLRAAHFTASLKEITQDLPQNHLVVLESDAFDGWVLVFRRHLLKMPAVKRRRVSGSHQEN